MPFRPREIAATHDREAQQREELRRDLVEFHLIFFGLTRKGEFAAAMAIAQWRVPGLGHGFDAGERHETIHQLTLEDSGARIVIALSP